MATMDPQLTCRLLTLPPELRITIYELVLHVPARPSGLASAYIRAPPNDLLLTCKRMCEDAAPTYVKAHRAYWKHTTFTVVHQEVTYDWTHLLNLIGESNIDSMSNVVVIPRQTLPAVPSTRRRIVLQDAATAGLGWTIEIGGIRIGSGQPLGIGMPTRVADQVAEIVWKHNKDHLGKPGLKRKLLKAVLQEACDA